jgi:hypothetical protein
MTQIIAFAGRKQSGKTTCSEMIVKYCNEIQNNTNVKIYNFADPLKTDICMNILGLTYDQCYGTDDNKNELTNNHWNNKQLTAREVMEFVGTDIFRSMQQNVWSDATLKKITTDNKELAIIADCRFPNEVEAIKNAGGVVIKLTRNPYNSTSAAEMALDPLNYDQRNFDIIITNHHMDIPQQTYAVFKFLHKKGILQL